MLADGFYVGSTPFASVNDFDGPYSREDAIQHLESFKDNPSPEMLKGLVLIQVQDGVADLVKTEDGEVINLLYVRGWNAGPSF